MFKVLSAHGRDAAAWQNELDKMPLELQDAHLLPGYARVQEVATKRKAYCAFNDCIMQPFLISDAGEMTGLWNFGGPIPNVNGDWTQCAAFEDHMLFWRKRNGVLSEVYQLAPSMADRQARYLAHVGVVAEHIKDAVAIDINKDDGALYMSLSRNRQRGIARAREAGHKARASDDSGRFAQLYAISMERLGTTPGWRFDTTFWIAFRYHLGFERVSLFFVDDVAALMLMHGYGVAHAMFLGRTDDLPMGALDLLYYESMRAMRDIGCHTYHLGGGLKKDDQLMQYKLGFSKRTLPVYRCVRSFEGAK